MQDQRHLPSSNALEEPFQSSMMIGMPVRKHHRTQFLCPHPQNIQIVQQGAPSQPRVIEHRFVSACVVHREQECIAMLCNKRLALEGIVGQWNTPHHLIACYEEINAVIEDNGHVE